MPIKKKPAKYDYASFADIFPWLRFQPKLTEAQKTKRDAMELKRKKMEKAHPRAHSKAFGENMERVEGGWIIEDPIYFIDSADLDKAQRKAYEKWLDGQTRPLIPGVEAASWPSDYARWYDSYVHGRTAIIND